MSLVLLQRTARREDLDILSLDASLVVLVHCELQLEPGHPFYDSLGRVPCERVGTIYGGAGDDEGWNRGIARKKGIYE